MYTCGVKLKNPEAKLSLKLDAPPFSINSAYYKKSKVRTQKCRAWGDRIHAQLSQPENAKKIVDFRTKIEEKSFIHAELRFYYPKSKLYTKRGGISRLSMDLSNIEKMLIDLLFDKKYTGRISDANLPIQTLCADDKLLTRLTSEKIVSPDNTYTTVVELSLFSLP